MHCAPEQSCRGVLVSMFEFDLTPQRSTLRRDARHGHATSSAEVQLVVPFDPFNFVSRANNGAVKACPNPNAAADPAIPNTGKNAHTKTTQATDVPATTNNRGRPARGTRQSAQNA